MFLDSPVGNLVDRFLPARFRTAGSSSPVFWHPMMDVVSHDAPAHLMEQFVATGHHARHFFPHRFHCLPKCGPDGYQLAGKMCGVTEADRLWQIVLYGSSPAIDEFPEELFFDSDISWHEQQFNHAGQVGSVTIAMRGDVAYTIAHQSDVVQRISRRRSFKTRIEKVFEGWHHLLLNAAAVFAAQKGMKELRVPSSGLAMENTDRMRHVQPELFERVYDRAVNQHYRAYLKGRWWSVDLGQNRESIVVPELCARQVHTGKTVCIGHDIERGLGHLDVDPGFAQRADADSRNALGRMLEIEGIVGVRATYAVVGSFLPEVREEIERGGHAIAFHSFDHDTANDQLEACRQVDYRIKGYRPPRSVVGRELRGSGLLRHNFEWLASSASSLGFKDPRLEKRLVRIPIIDDDFDMHRGVIDFEQWARRSINAIRNRDFVALSLHDCYASHWLDGYERFLEEVKALAQVRTMNEVAADLFLSGGV